MARSSLTGEDRAILFFGEDSLRPAVFHGNGGGSAPLVVLPVHNKVWRRAPSRYMVPCVG